MFTYDAQYHGIFFSQKVRVLVSFSFYGDGTSEKYRLLLWNKYTAVVHSYGGYEWLVGFRVWV